MENRIQLRIREKIRETEQAVTLVLEPAGAPLSYLAGQFITLVFKNLGAKEVRRSYSFSSAPAVDAYPTITVKKVPNGSVSRYLADQAAVGEMLEAIPPAGQFVLPADGVGVRDIFLIGGGSGIVPLYSLLKQTLCTEVQSQVTLIMANSNEASIIFRNALRQYAQSFSDRLQVVYLLSSTHTPLADLQQEEFPIRLRVQRLSNALVEELVQQFLRFDPLAAHFYLCGPKNLMLKAEQMLRYMQFSEAQIHREVFDIAAPYRPPREIYQDSMVHIHWQGQVFTAPVRAGETILEAAARSGLELPYSCQSGICTTCVSRCLSGDVEMFTPAGKITASMSNGVVFTCVGYPLTEEVTIRVG